MKDYRDQVAHDDQEGGIVIETKQDVSDIVEKNKKEFNFYTKSSRWSDEPLGNKIASIPNTAIDHLNQMGIMRGHAVLDQKKFYAWLNHPDNRFFRTRPGKI